MTEMSGSKSCPSCGGGNIKALPKIKIPLPTPSREKIYGPGPSPRYSTEMELPMDYCLDCGTVIYRNYKEK